MGFAEAVFTAFHRYFDFKGKSGRPEYWYFALFLFILGIGAAVQDSLLGTGGLLAAIASIGTFIPSIAVSVRRLHDIGRSGWWLLIVFVPVIGLLVLIYWACTAGDVAAGRVVNPVVE